MEAKECVEVQNSEEITLCKPIREVKKACGKAKR